MFFPDDLVTNRTFKNVWRAAHNQEADTDDVEIPKVCNSISKLMDDYSDNHLRHLSFRTASTLLLGTVKTYKKQLDKLSKDAFDLAYEMEFGTPNDFATGHGSSSNGADEEHSNPGNKETLINISDSDDNEEEMNGNTRALNEEPEEYFDPGDEETSINNGDLNDSEDELNGNTRVGARSSAKNTISNVARELSPIIGARRTIVVNQTAKDIRSKSKADEEHSNPGNKETLINISDSDDNEEEMNGNTRALNEEPEEYFDPGDEETWINNSDINDSEDELNGNTRVGARSSAKTTSSNVARELSLIIEAPRTIVVNQTAKDIRSKSKAGEKHSNPGNKESLINISDSDDNEEEMNGNTRAINEELEEYFDPGNEETWINNSDINDSEDELNGNTRVGARSSATNTISNVTRELSPIIRAPRTIVVNHTAKDIRSKSKGSRKRKSDDEESGGEGTSSMAGTSGAHRSKVMRSPEVQKNKRLIKNQNSELDYDLPIARITVYAAGSRRPVKTIWCNVNPDVMNL